MKVSSGNDAAVSEFGAFVSDTCKESFPSECPLKGLLFSSKVLCFRVENASVCVILGLLTAVLATGKAITARRMFGRVWIRYCTILEREESRSAAQTRASQYALSLTVTVMFLMSSPSGGTERFLGLPSTDDCPRMEGNYLQNLAARLVGKRERTVVVRGLPGLDFQTWETLEAGVGENEKRRVGVHRLPHLKIEMWATQLIEQMWATRRGKCS